MLITQKELAQKVGLSPQRLTMYKKGYRNPPLSLLEDVKEKLNLKSLDEALHILRNPQSYLSQKNHL